MQKFPCKYLGCPESVTFEGVISLPVNLGGSRLSLSAGHEFHYHLDGFSNAQRHAGKLTITQPAHADNPHQEINFELAGDEEATDEMYLTCSLGHTESYRKN
jgi:hypothetical protein